MIKKKGNVLTGKIEYILKALSKISPKKWEHYVINRIYHRLSDPDIEFICQQCVRKKEGGIYLMDLYFPALGIYLEIDEGHHFNDDAKISDAKRKFDIIEVTGLEEHRISVVNIPLEKLNAEVDRFIALLKAKKELLISKNQFNVWKYDENFTAKYHIDAGYIDISPKSAFRTHKDALSCFGYQKGHFQRGAWKIPDEKCNLIDIPNNSIVWFPTLDNHKEWDNSLSDDGLLIIEKKKEEDKLRLNLWENRIVMAKSRDEYNRILYRFIGVFEIIPEYSHGNEHRFRRISPTVKTCS